jgi:hypothetical protein
MGKECAMEAVKERVTTEYLDFPGGKKVPFIAQSDWARELVVLRNKAVLAHGWLSATQDEINEAIETGGPNGDGIYGLKWVH